MRAERAITGTSRSRRLAAVAAGAFVLFATAEARTAAFDASFPYTPGPMVALSAAGDNSGQFVGLGEWISLLFVQPFGMTRSSTVSIFTLAPPVGNARVMVSIGSYNNGSPIFVDTKSVNAGNTLTINNLFQQGCSALGGCDFIFITTTRARQGASGAVIDYVSVNGEPTEVTAPTPEPSVWALMIIGFAGLAWRLKSQRGSSPSSANGAPARCSR